MRKKPSPADIDLAINQAKHGGWIDPTDEPDGWECLLPKPRAMRALCLILALVAFMPHARAQPLPPDQACSEIVKTLDRITGHRDSNQEAVRRGFIACRTGIIKCSYAVSGHMTYGTEVSGFGLLG